MPPSKPAAHLVQFRLGGGLAEKWLLIQADLIKFSFHADPAVALVLRTKEMASIAKTAEKDRAHRLKARNPRTGLVDFETTVPTTEEIQEVSAKLRSNQQEWSNAGLDHRIEVLTRWGEAILKRREAILEALIQDTGRFLLSKGEVLGIPEKIRRWSELGRTLFNTDRYKSAVAPTVSYQTQYVPYPLVGVISPWNFPITLGLIDALPALVAGCAVLIKPSEITPRFIDPFRQSIADVPELAAVLDIMPGDGDAGRALIDQVDVVCLTGSVATGRKVAQAAAQNFIPAFLELGGKDAALVLEGADIDRAADVVLRQSVINAGQVCYSIERVYVQKSVYDHFLQVLLEKAKKLEINYPDLYAGHIGPIISQEQTHIIEQHLEDAVQKGAKILSGGGIEVHDGGQWCRATVLTNVTHEMTLMRDETFGPLIPVMGFETVEEGIALANDSDYGLTASVFAGTEDESLAVAKQIDAGAVSINDSGLHSLTKYEAEKNAFKYSGLGPSRMGAEGILRFLKKKALIFQKGSPRTMDQLGESNATR